MQEKKKFMNKNKITHDSNEILSFVPIRFSQRGRRKSIIPVRNSLIIDNSKKLIINRSLINAIAKAFYWSKLINLGIVASGTEIAHKEGLDPSTVNEQLRLALLSPKIIEKILIGTQSKTLTTQWLTRNTFPSNWSKQTEIFK